MIRQRVLAFSEGIYYRFPLCCVLRFTLAWHFWGQAIRRGVVDPHGENPYVPCGFFHRGAPWHEIDSVSGYVCDDHG